MGQYEVARLIFDSEQGLTFRDIMKKRDVVESSCRTSIIKLEKKDIIKNRDGRYYPHPDADENDLERIRTYTIDELKGKK